MHNNITTMDKKLINLIVNRLQLIIKLKQVKMTMIVCRSIFFEKDTIGCLPKKS
ncbi:hypothetical protein [Candidatus Profftia lariciata]|uniref:hypothetical protein n=1 Tax=Candidatus Profftia lariciata TaxID=1987921 RepID=UPI001D0162EE|nr:hypothetical protein [Candidatus Profftia lariciata]